MWVGAGRLLLFGERGGGSTIAAAGFLLVEGQRQEKNAVRCWQPDLRCQAPLEPRALWLSACVSNPGEGIPVANDGGAAVEQLLDLGRLRHVQQGGGERQGVRVREVGRSVLGLPRRRAQERPAGAARTFSHRFAAKSRCTALSSSSASCFR